MFTVLKLLLKSAKIILKEQSLFFLFPFRDSKSAKVELMARDENEDNGLPPSGGSTDRFLLVCKGNTADGYTSKPLAKEIV